MTQMNTPSISNDFELPAEPPSWPKALGIFSIVWAVLGITCSGCMGVSTLGGSAMYEWGRQMQIKGGQPDPGAMPAPFIPTGLDMLGIFLWFVGVVLLLIAGIALVRRSAKGRMLSIVYAAVSLLGTLVWIISAAVKAPRLAEWIAQNPGHPFLKNPGTSMGQSILPTLVIASIAAIFPIFCLVWFGMKGKRPEFGASVEEFEA